MGRGVRTGPWSVGHLYGITEALPGVLGNRGTRAYFQGNKGPKMRGNRGTKAILGNREHRKSRFWFWGTGDKGHLFQGNKGTGTPPPPRLHHHAMCMVTHIQLFCAFSVCFRPGNRKNTLRVYVRGLCDLCSCHIGLMRVREGLVGV